MILIHLLKTLYEQGRLLVVFRSASFQPPHYADHSLGAHPVGTVQGHC